MGQPLKDTLSPRRPHDQHKVYGSGVSKCQSQEPSTRPVYGTDKALDSLGWLCARAQATEPLIRQSR